MKKTIIIILMALAFYATSSFLVAKAVQPSTSSTGQCRVTVWAETPAADQCLHGKVMTGYRDGRVWCSRVDVRCD